ncbi:hypothetical protein JW756_03735 [Candidatus Woesearchaeota archaeon]|nr:hypothetical protein [Candidatus Woesearchaeota archaeon]
MIDEIINILRSQQIELEKQWKQRIEDVNENNLAQKINSLSSQISYLERTKETGQYEGEVVTGPYKRKEMKIFYYLTEKKQGLVLQYGKLGFSTVSYGHLEREDFLKQYNLAAKEMKTAETKRKVKKYSVISLPFVIIPAVVYGIKKLIEHKKK